MEAFSVILALALSVLLALALTQASLWTLLRLMPSRQPAPAPSTAPNQE